MTTWPDVPRGMGPHLPTLTDCREAGQAWRDALDVVRPLAELQQLALEQEQTERAHVAFMDRHMPEAE